MNNKLKLLALGNAVLIVLVGLETFALAVMITESGQHSPIRVACVGDSITEVSGYPSYLQSLLGSQYLVENFGVSGATVLLNSWRPYMNQLKFQNAKEFQPNMVVIILGTNDGLHGLHQYNESFQDDYAKLITQFRQLESKPQIWIVKPPPIFSNSSDLSSTYFTQTIISQIEEVANKQNLPIIDIYSAFGNHTDYFKDGVHPNSQGAALLASEVYNAINEQNSRTT
jgi:lysophospholipase L1-like esterase